MSWACVSLWGLNGLLQDQALSFNFGFQTTLKIGLACTGQVFAAAVVVKNHDYFLRVVQAQRGKLNPTQK